MANRQERLARCFTAVFSELTDAAARAARVDTVEAWDSLASLTLVAVVEEEFGLAIDDLELSELDSFAAFDAYVGARTS